MTSEFKSVCKQKIYGNLNIPVSFRHPTTDGSDRQWVGFVREVYVAADTCLSDRFVLRGCFISEISSEASEKTIFPSLSSNIVDLQGGRPIESSGKWLIEIFTRRNVANFGRGHEHDHVHASDVAIAHDAEKRVNVVCGIIGCCARAHRASTIFIIIFMRILKLIVRSGIIMPVIVYLALGIAIKFIANLIG